MSLQDLIRSILIDIEEEMANGRNIQLVTPCHHAMRMAIDAISQAPKIKK